MKKIMGLTAVLLTMCVMLCSCKEAGTKKKNIFLAGDEDVGVLLDKEVKMINLDTGKIADVPLTSEEFEDIPEDVDEFLYISIVSPCYRIGNKVYAAGRLLVRDLEGDGYLPAQDLIFELPENYDQILAADDGTVFGRCFYYVLKDNKIMLYCYYRDGKFVFSYMTGAGTEVRLVEDFVIDLPNDYDCVFPISNYVSLNGIAIGVAQEDKITIIYGGIINFDDKEVRFDKAKLKQKTIRLPDAYDTIIGIRSNYDMDSLEIVYIQNDRIKVYNVKERKITRDVFAGSDFKVEPKKKTAKKAVKAGKTSAPATKDNSDKSIDDVIDHFGTYFDVYRDLPWASVDSDYFLYAGAMDGCCAEIDDNEVYILKFDTSDAGANSILRNIRETNLLSLPLGVKIPAIVNGAFVLANYQAHPKKNKVIEVFSEF